jgi:hypothetical protein
MNTNQTVVSRARVATHFGHTVVTAGIIRPDMAMITPPNDRLKMFGVDGTAR